MRPFDLTPATRPPAERSITLEALQGFASTPQRRLRREHNKPPLVELQLIRSGVPSKRVFAIRGDSATLGRYSPVTGPVDIDLSVLQDHERYRVGLPHARIFADEDQWRIEPLTWSYTTSVEGEPVGSGGTDLAHGSFVGLGSALFQIFVRETPEERTADFLAGASLLLKRDGAVQDVQITLDDESVVAGRPSPQTGTVDLDLSGLHDHERVYVARRHARFFSEGTAWYVESLGPRGPVFINRGSNIRGAKRLNHGDEVALGNVMFQFCCTEALSAMNELTRADTEDDLEGPSREGGDSE